MTCACEDTGIVKSNFHKICSAVRSVTRFWSIMNIDAVAPSHILESFFTEYMDKRHTTSQGTSRIKEHQRQRQLTAWELHRQCMVIVWETMENASWLDAKFRDAAYSTYACRQGLSHAFMMSTIIQLSEYVSRDVSEQASSGCASCVCMHGTPVGDGSEPSSWFCDAPRMD